MMTYQKPKEALVTYALYPKILVKLQLKLFVIAYIA